MPDAASFTLDRIISKALQQTGSYDEDEVRYLGAVVTDALLDAGQVVAPHPKAVTLFQPYLRIGLSDPRGE